MATFAGKTREEIVGMAERFKAKAMSMKEAASEAMGTALQTVEIGGLAFGFGWLRGRYADAQGNFEVLGAPPDLLAAVVLHGLGYMGTFDKYTEHAHNLGDGALAAYLAVKGVQFGVESRQTATPKTSGVPSSPRQMNPGVPQNRMSADQIAQNMRQRAYR